MQHMEHSQGPKRGHRAGPPLPIMVASGLVFCSICLFGFVFHYSKPSHTMIQVHGAGFASEHDSAAELQKLLKEMQTQVAEMQKTLPKTIEQQLKTFYETNPLQQPQQQQPQQQPQPQQQQQQPVVHQPQRGAQQPGGVFLADHQVHHIGMARAACDKRSSAGIKLRVTDKLVAPIVVVAHNRVHYLAKCLVTIYRYWSEDPENKERFPLFVSVDGGDQATMQFAAALNWGAEVQVIHNLRDPSRCKPNQGYCNLSVHYHMLLQLFFECHKVPRLLFMEEDLEIAPDFFSYFRAMAPVLDSDKSLMCVSAWNDHGQRGRALNSSQVYRTDIFPGLGWMLTASFAKEIYQDWPNELWDEYMRRPKVRQGRQCLFPEVPRTHTFGKVGTSGGQFFDQHLAVMLLNNDKIDWTKQDLSQLEGAAYAQQMDGWLKAAQPLDPAINIQQYCAITQPADADTSDLLVHYSDQAGFTALAKKLPPMLFDHKGGPVEADYPLVPRASYKGVTIVRCRGRRLFIAPLPGSAAEPRHGLALGQQPQQQQQREQPQPSAA